jgi:plasmid maintenance system killer protein
LALVELHVMERKHTKVSAAEMLDFIEASSFGNFLSAIPSDLHATLRADLRQLWKRRVAGMGLRTVTTA